MLKSAFFLFLTVLMLGCSARSAKTTSAANENLFVWERPHVTPSNLPIWRAATCKFKKTLAVGLDEISAPEGQNAAERLYYRQSSTDEAHTVSFLDLDTSSPKVQTNGTQSPVSVIQDSGQSMTLLNQRQGAGAFELYTIFRSNGVVIYSRQQNGALIGPFGVLEMGYCN
jgi:hypothetical protein